MIFSKNGRLRRKEGKIEKRIKRVIQRRNKRRNRRKGHFFETWLDRYPVENKDLQRDPVFPGRSAEKLPCQAQLDLHGYTAEEAERAVNTFINSAFSQGKRKVLIIHGKGNHSSSGGKLKNVVYRALDQSPLAGRRGIPGKMEGGSGAVWVVLRQRSR